MYRTYQHITGVWLEMGRVNSTFNLTCMDKFMYMLACLASSIIIIMHARNYLEVLSHCGHGHDLTSVARRSVINIAELQVLSIKHWQQSA